MDNKRIELCAYLPTALVPIIQPQMSLAFLEPCDDRDYIEYYRHYKGTKILDNGIIEFGASISARRLADYSSMVGADFIIPPDKLGDWDYNFTSASEYSANHYIAKSYLLPCLAGPYARDFEYQYRAVYNQYYGGMCLPYRTNRIPIPVIRGLRLHLLGLKWPEDYEPYIRLNTDAHLSLDTTEFVSAAYRGLCYRTNGFETSKRPKHYHSLRADDELLGLIVDNMNWLQQRMTLK